MSENISSPKFEKDSQEQKSEKERIDTLKGLCDRLLNEHYNAPGEFLSREDRVRLRESDSPEDAVRLDKYEKSKYRNNYFMKVFGFLDLITINNILGLKNYDEVVRKKEKLFSDFGKLQVPKSVDKPIPPEIVEESNELLKEIWSELNKEESK